MPILRFTDSRINYVKKGQQSGMTSEVLESTGVIKTINKHLTEDTCIHNIYEIMQEALENIGAGVNAPVTALETKDRLHGVPNHAIEDR
jgi:hypothetical protein